MTIELLKSFFKHAKPLRPDLVFLVLGSFFGLLFVFLNPPCATPDEPVHLLRSFRVAQGHLFVTATVEVPSLDRYCHICDLVGVMNIPSHMNEELLEFIKESGSDKLDYEFSSGYPPVPYLPSAFIIKLLSAFSPPLAVYLYFGRLVTFVVSLLITWYAIRLIPTGKWILLASALMPMRLYQMSSISPDSITTSIVSLFIALVVYLVINHDSDYCIKKLPLLIFTSLLLLFAKPMYVFLLPMLLAIPFANRKYAAIICVVFAIIAILAGVKVYSMLTAYLVTSQNVVQLLPTIDGQSLVNVTDMTSEPDFIKRVNHKAQVALLLHEPSKLFNVIWNGYKLFGQDMLRGTIGDLGWLHVKMPNLIMQLATLLLILSILINKQETVGVRFRIMALSVFVLMSIAIPLGLYLANTPVGADFFIGGAGRYYIPFIPFALLAISLPVFNPKLSFMPGFIVTIGMLTVLIASVLALWNAYYALPKTVGVLRLTAKSDASASLVFATSLGKGLFTGRGRYSLLPSDAPLQYEYRIPAGDIKLASLTMRSLKPVKFKIQSAELISLDGVLLKRFDPTQIQLARVMSDGTLQFTSPRNMDELILDKESNTIFFHDAAISPRITASLQSTNTHAVPENSLGR